MTTYNASILFVLLLSASKQIFYACTLLTVNNPQEKEISQNVWRQIVRYDLYLKFDINV